MLDHVGSSVAARYWRIAGSVAVICAKLTTGELWGIPAANYSESQFLGPSFPASGWATETFWVLVLHCFHTRHVTESRTAYFACSVKQKLLGHISSCTLLFTSCVLQAACWDALSWRLCRAAKHCNYRCEGLKHAQAAALHPVVIDPLHRTAVWPVTGNQVPV